MNDIAQGHTVVYYKETVYDDFKSNEIEKHKDGNDVYHIRRLVRESGRQYWR